MFMALLLSSMSPAPTGWMVLLLLVITHCVFALLAGLICMLRNEAEPIMVEQHREREWRK